MVPLPGVIPILRSHHDIALLLLLLLSACSDVSAFWGEAHPCRRYPSWSHSPHSPHPPHPVPLCRTTTTVHTAKTRTTAKTKTTELRMVFDFFRERTKEGIGQIQNLQNAALQGQWGQGLADAAAYTSMTNQAFANGLQKSRHRLLDDLETLWTGVSPDAWLDELQTVLLQADLGTATTEEIVAEVQSMRDNANVRLSKDDFKSIMRGKLLEALGVSTTGTAVVAENPTDTDIPTDTDPTSSPSHGALARAICFQPPSTDATLPHIPTVLFIMGANGMGKTTTIGKLAHRLRVEGNQTVVLAACDTFRAGAVAQLQQWADRAHVHLIGPAAQTTSPSAVLYAALDYSVTHRVDTLIVDTSGRLSNNDALTQELAKMKRVIQKRLSTESVETTDANGQSVATPVPNLNVPHETLLVVDASQGRAALDSARTWNDAIGLTGLVLTKLDGSARGGSVVAVSRDLQLPVKLVGVGEGIEDLRDFDPDTFVDALLGIGKAGGSSLSNEGAMLASRLTEMRRERDVRAKARSAATPIPPQPSVATTVSTNANVQSSLDTPVGASRSSGTKAKSKSKKKKGK